MENDTRLQIIWGRMEGFPYWPARVCSSIERLFLIARNPGQKYDDRVAIMFLGNVRQSGWVKATSVSPFTADSLPAHPTVPLTSDTDTNYFSAKQFKKDRDFRAAVLEAVRLCQAEGMQFSTELIDLIANADKDVDWIRDDLCSACGGSELSGVSLVCEKCEKFEIHFHCLDPPLLTPPDGDWFCPDCCKKARISFQHQMTEDAETQVQKQLDALNKVRTKKRKLSSSDNASLLGITLGIGNPASSATNGGKNANDEGQQSNRSRGRQLVKTGKAVEAPDGDCMKYYPPSKSRRWSGNVESDEKDGGKVPISNRSGGSRGGGRGNYEDSWDEADTYINPQQHATHSRDGRFNSRRPSDLLVGSSQDLVSSRVRNSSGSAASRNRHGRSNDYLPESCHGGTDVADGVDQNIEICRMEDDVCSVCKDGGKLILCDFPTCSRAFHQVCISKQFSMSPESLEFASNDDDHAEEMWFCPAHRCVVCEIQQENNIRPNQLPTCLIFEWTTKGAEPPQKPLKSCPSCAQSICYDCDSHLQQILRQNGYRPRRNTEKEPICLCINCTFPHPIVKLGKIMEKALARGLRSRLAIPFFHPLLPIVGVKDTVNSEDISHWTLPYQHQYPFLLEKPIPRFIVDNFLPNFWVEQRSVAMQLPASQSEYLDLSMLLENVRSLRYDSVERFLLDLNEVMIAARHKLCTNFQDIAIDSNSMERESHGEPLNPESYLDVQHPYFKIMTALEAVVVLCVNYLYDQRDEIESLQEQILGISNKKPDNKLAHIHSLGTISWQASRDEVVHALRNLLVPGANTSSVDGSIISMEEMVNEKTDAAEPITDTNTEKVHHSQIAMTSGGNANASDSTIMDIEDDKHHAISPSKKSPNSSPSISLASSWRRLTNLTSCSLQALTSSSLSLFTHDDDVDDAGNDSMLENGNNASDQDEKCNTGHAAIEAAISLNHANSTQNSKIPLASRMWRLECEYQNPYMKSANSGNAPSNAVIPKTLVGWIAFIDDGALAHHSFMTDKLGHFGTHIYGYPIDIKNFAQHATRHPRLIVNGLCYGSGAWANSNQTKEEFVSEWVKTFAEDRQPQLLTREVVGDILMSLKQELPVSAASCTSARNVGDDPQQSFPCSGNHVVLINAQEGVGLAPGSGGISTVDLNSSYLHPDAYRGEAVTLLESHSSASTNGSLRAKVGSWAHGLERSNAAAANATSSCLPYADEVSYMEGVDDYLVQDETLLLLDRVRDLTTKTLHMQTRLRREYVENKRAKILYGSEPVSIGDANLIQEMKLANDQLRWNMQQKQQALDEALKTIAVLRSNLGSQQK